MNNGYVKESDIRTEIYTYESCQNKELIWKPISLIDEFTPPITYQGIEGNCGMHSMLGVCEYQFNRLSTRHFNYSNLYDYSFSRKAQWYLTKDLSGVQPSKNTGVSHIMSCKVGVKNGLIPIGKHPDNLPRELKPSYESLRDASSNKIKAFYKIKTKQGLIDCLNRKIPVIFGYSDKIAKAAKDTGRVPKDFDWNQDLSPNHSNSTWEYNGKNEIRIRNSWKDFGIDGYFFVDFDLMWEHMYDVMCVIVESEDVVEKPNFWEVESLNHNLPKDIVIIGNNAYDRVWANKSENVDFIQNELKKSKLIFIVDKKGRLSTNLGLTIDEKVLFNNIGSYIYYKDVVINLWD